MNIIKKSIVLIVINLLCVCTLLSNETDYIDKLIKKYKPTGATVVIIKDNQVHAVKNYGYEDKHIKKYVNNDTEYRIASISKTFTAYGIMKLVDRGVLDLDESISRYIKRWNLPDSEFNNDKVTLRNLLSHTAGISSSDEQYNEKKLPTLPEALSIKEVVLKREPGEVFEYSEFSGYGICQLVIEDVTGMSFEQYMETEILNELGIDSVTFNNEINSNLSKSYIGPGILNKFSSYVMTAAGGGISSGEGLAKFVIQLMNYWSPQNSMFQIQSNTLTHGDGYCLGLVAKKLDNDRTIYMHNGTLTGWNSFFAIEPLSKEGIVILTNSDAGFYLTYDIIEKWGEDLFEQKIEDQAINGVKKVIGTINIVFWIILIFAFLIFIRSLNNKTLILNKNSNLIFKSVSISLSVILYIFYLMLLYSSFLIEWVFKIKDYYLFTFFPPTIHLISLSLGILLILFCIRTQYKKVSRK